MAAEEITRLLDRVRAGDRQAEAQLMEAVYPDLKRCAARLLRAERPGHTLQATALVNEAYLQLFGRTNADWKNRVHFLAAAAQSMRRILVDYAKRRKAAKRGGVRHQVELTEGLVISDDRVEEIIAIDELLTQLAKWDARQCRIVELLIFGGLKEHEVADVMGIGGRTVSRDWQHARAWLVGELKRPTGKSSDHDTHIKG
jgi:RNA polymerase sigma factor (TIGR02999 family)